MKASKMKDLRSQNETKGSLVPEKFIQFFMQCITAIYSRT